VHLLRHAKSSWDDPGLKDHDRPLTPRGDRDARRIGAYLREQGIRIDLVLCSTAERAQRTYRRMASGLGSKPEFRLDRGLYSGTPEDVLDRLRALPDPVTSVMVVGHNPTLHDLAIMLAGGGDPDLLVRLETKFPTAALATLAFEGEWRDLYPGVAALEALVTPKDLGE
jgi:phosphohistidine phosphatase